MDTVVFIALALIGGWFAWAAIGWLVSWFLGERGPLPRPLVWIAVGLLVLGGVGAVVSPPHPAASQAGQRYGAICNDGWRSSATGSGACSHHGGVDYWLVR